ncbi:MAG: DUF1501 domain-containing protein [Verrucomicrobiota bacterium]|nr:DUF1501 domain-containing protein [Verrucomicrobiota bacterium]
MNSSFIDRRQFVERCALGAFGLSILPNLSAVPSVAGQNGFGKAKRIIFLQVRGGMSHIDTFDPKDGKSKGPGKAIRTKSDFQVTEYLPKIAGIADKIAVIRSMTAKVGVHGPAQYFMRTAFTERNTIKHPNLGAWAQHYLGESHDTLPSSACINAGAKHGNGFFPTAYSPIPILNPSTGLRNIRTRGGSEALSQRLALSEKLSSFFSARFPDPQVKSYREFYDNTLRLLRSKDLDSFDLNKESSAMRKKYGMGKFGQGCLLARRLVETGVRYVEVSTDGWDMHNNLESEMQDLSPAFDQAYAALISDLDDRGMLDDTLVVMATEFGRKPQFNGNGRGHYPICYSTVLAGGGVKRGFVHGSSDKEGAYPEDPVTVHDLHATIGWAAGLPLDKEVLTASGRPFVVGGAKAKPVMGLFA